MKETRKKMGFKMKMIFLTVVLTTYGVWECTCFSISDVAPTPLGVNMSLQLDVTLTDSLQLDVTLTDSTLSNPTCLYDADNGELAANELVSQTSGTYTVSFPYSGFFNILTICLNEANYDNFTLNNVYVGNVITGPSATGGLNDVIIPVNWPVVSDVALPISFDTGTDVQVVATVERSGGTYIDSGFNETITKDLVISLSEFATPGMYAVTIRFSNPLSTVNITVVLAVYEPIDVTSVVFSPASYEAAVSGGVYYVMTDTPFNIVTTFAGGDATITWEVIRVDGPNTTVDLPGFFCAGMVDTHTFNYTFSTTGLHYLRLVVSNHINEYQHPLITVKSQYGVNGFSSVVTDETTLKANAVDFLLNVAETASYDDMGNVLCTFDFGNSYNASYTFYYTTALTPLTYTETYTYPEIGHFIAVVRCANELPPMVNDAIQSYQEFVYYMKVLNPVANLVLTHTSSNITYHPYSEAITFTFALTDPTNNTQLPNITCFVDFGPDGNFLATTGDATSTSTVAVVESAFPNGEVSYTGSFNCSNELTSQTFHEITFYVYFDCWLQKYFDYEYRNPETPLIAYTHVPYTIRAEIRPSGQPVCIGPVVPEWKIFDNTSTPVGPDVVVPPTTPSFYIEGFTFPKGIFKFEFTTEFSGSTLPSKPRMTDFAYVKYDVTDLAPKITDENGLENSIRGSLLSSNFVIDSRGSHDPAENPDPTADQTWLTSTPLVKQWKCVMGAASTISHAKVTSYIAGGALPNGTTACPAAALPGGSDQDMYDIAANTFEADRWYLYEMNYSRGVDRSAVAKQAVHVTLLPSLTLGIYCIENCFNSSGTRKKIRLAALQVNVAIRDHGVDNSSATYAWTVEQYEPPGLTKLIDITDLVTGFKNGTGFKVPKEIFAGSQPGTTFVVSCTVSIEDYQPTKISQLYIYNYPPYNGNCTIDKRAAVAAIDLVCVDCRGYLDENLNLERNLDVDQAGGLTYAFLQRYIDDNEEINPEYLEIQLDASSNPKQCVKLRLPPDEKNKTMVELRVLDYMRTPYAFERFIVDINPPVANDISGDAGAADVNNLIESSTAAIDSAAQVGDVSSTALIIGAIGSCLSMGGPEIIYNVALETNVEDGAFSDVKPDGTVVSWQDAMEDLTKKPTDATTLAIQEAKAKLASQLAQAQDNASSDLQTNPVLQRTLLSSAKTLVTGDEQGISNDLLTLAGNIVSRAAEEFGTMFELHGDTEEFTDFIVECLDTLGTLSGAIQNNDAVHLLGDMDPANVRSYNQFQYDFSSAEQKEAIDFADLSIDERIYTMYKRNLGIAARTEERMESGTLQSERIDLFLDNLMSNVISSDNAANQFGNPEESRILATTTRLTPEMASKTTLKGSQVAVHLPELETNGKINVAVLEDKTVVNMDKKGRFAQVTSKEVHFELQMETPLINGLIKFDFKITPAVYKTVYPVVFSDDADKFARGQTWARSPDDMVCISNRPLSDRVDYYKVWISCSGHVSKLNFDAEEDLNEDNNWTNCFLPSVLSLTEPGICRFGIETFFKDDDSESSSRKKRAVSNDTLEDYPPMNQTTATMACMVLNDNKEWVSDQCAATWIPEEDKLICECLPEKKMTFANSFYVPPNTIDFSSVFLKFSPLNQAAVMGVLAGILVIYVLICVWARRKDKKDLLKWGITPLADNFAEDNYFYVIKVYTGMRPGAKTRSKVGMVIAGDEMDTGVRELSDGVRKEFSTGSVVNFLMSTTVYLGELEYIRIWHDNSGRGNLASWYLSKIEVQDVQRNETFSFLAERWLAVDKDDGMLECVVPVCKVENLNVFKNRFYMNAKENLADSHIWVSVVYRPVTSHFTRVQRATCALVFLMLTMISNAMFFRGEENYETPAQVQVGPFRFTMQQIYISLICALITTPATLVIIYLFKLSKPKPPLEDKPLFAPTSTTTPGGAGSQRAKRYKIPLVETWMEKHQRKSMELEQSLICKGYPKFDGFNLPYWCIYLAWFLAFAAWFLCGFFIMLYSMEWGKQKSEEWLTTFFLSFFESVFCLDPVKLSSYWCGFFIMLCSMERGKQKSEEWLTTFFLSFFESVCCLDPVKIAVMAVVFAILVRSAQDSKSVVDRSTIMRKYKSNLRGKSGGIRLPAPPVDDEKLEKIRAHRQLELKVKTAFKDIIFNLFIIWILFSLSYATRDVWSYHMHQETFETLLHPRGQTSFFDIKTIDGFFDWLNNTAINNLFPENDMTGERLHWRLRQFLGDGAKFRVGPPRLRQVRTTERKCEVPYFGESDCYKGYSELTEDTDDYCIGWKNTPCDPDEKVYKHSSEAWRFTSALDIWGVPIAGYYTTYGGGGYISKLSVNREVSHLILDELYQNSWVDRQTRSVVFEFTLYCLNTNIFTYNVFMAEFPETGGVNPYVMILPLRVYMHNGALGLYTLLCEVIFLLYLVVITVYTIILLVQQKKAYFKKPWQVFDFVFIIFSYLTMIMYFVRLVMTDKSLSIWREDQKEFVNFYHVALWDQMFVLMVGILAFMSVIRLLNVLGYNKRINAVARVFSNAASELLWFGIFFLNVFMCYAVFGYLLFGSKLRSYKNVYKTMGTLFISMIGKSRFTEIEDTDPIMSKIYFMFFIFFVVYMMLTMFLAMLSKSIDQVHADTKTRKGDELVDYIVNKFKGLLSNRREDNQPRGLSGAIPPAPWNVRSKQKWNEIDNRAILEDIRQSLNDAIIFDPEGLQKKAKGPGPTPGAAHM